MYLTDCHLPLQTYYGSDIDIFSFGNPINTAALFIILLHLLIECKSVVSTLFPEEYIPNRACLQLSLKIMEERAFCIKLNK